MLIRITTVFTKIETVKMNGAVKMKTKIFFIAEALSLMLQAVMILEDSFSEVVI